MARKKRVYIVAILIFISLCSLRFFNSRHLDETSFEDAPEEEREEPLNLSNRARLEIVTKTSHKKRPKRPNHQPSPASDSDIFEKVSKGGDVDVEASSNAKQIQAEAIVEEKSKEKDSSTLTISDQVQDDSAAGEELEEVVVSEIDNPNSDYNLPDSQQTLFSGDLLAHSEGGVDFKAIAEKLRIYVSLFMDVHIYGPSSSPNSTSIKKAKWLEIVETHLFPWIKTSFKSTAELNESFASGTQGIVICIGNGQTKMAAGTLKMIRKVHGSTIPVEVFFTGDDDLSSENRDFLETIPNVKTKDITKIFNNDILQIGGWAIKPFALLASSFEKAMLIDADVVFLQSPESLFSSRLFTKNGALFFHDRSLFSHAEETIKWFKDLIPPEKVNDSQHLRVFNGKTAHEQESGVVLVNKKEGGLQGLLAACTLNVGPIRAKSYDFVFGDKETFWLGFETVSAPYHFNGFYPGTIGVAKPTKDGKSEICGRQILHVDENEVPMWINGGIQESKYDHSTPIVQMESFVREPGEWTLHQSNLACLVIEREPSPLSKIFAEIIHESGEILMDTINN